MHLDADISSFYSLFPEIYWAISRDRDFAREADALLGLCPAEPSVVVEAFAGPAYHSAVLRRRLPGSQIICIDSAQTMRDVALAQEQAQGVDYQVALVQDTVQAMDDGSVSLFLAMRYSVGYLDHSDLLALLQDLARILKLGGVAVFELHNLAKILTNPEELAIRKRSVQLGGVQVECIWPDGPLAWDEEDWTASMPVTVVWRDEAGLELGRRAFHSRERIYPVADAARFVEGTPGLSVFKPSAAIANEFANSKLLCVRRDVV